MAVLGEVLVDHEGGGTIFTKDDLDRAKADARKTGHAYVDGVPLTEAQVGGGYARTVSFDTADGSVSVSCRE